MNLLFATVPHPWTIHSSLYPPLRHTQPSQTAYFLLGFPLRLSHAHARLRPRKHLKRRRSAIARRTHPHAQFSAGVFIFKSAKPYGLTLSGCYPAFGAEAAHLVPGAPDSINRLRFYLPPFVRRRSHELPFTSWQHAAYSARYFRVGLAR